MKIRLLFATALSLCATGALAETKTERCAAYAREAMAETSATTGPVRGTVRGAAVGAIGGAIGGNAGTGAAIGAGAGLVVGAVRRNNQKRRSYEYYFDRCMG